MLKKILVTVVVAYVVYHMCGDDEFNPEMVRGLKVVVTGASTGIGEQLAYQYAQMGAHLVITARREPQLKKVLEKCREIAPSESKLEYLAADMGKTEDTKRLVQFAVEKLGGIDQVVMNHAFYDKLDFWRGSQENITELHTFMDINFYSLVHLWSEAMQYLIKSERGALGVVSSISGKVPTPFDASYSASKFALDGFFGAIRQELKEAKHNVSVTLHVLGLIRTVHAMEGYRHVIDHFQLDERLVEFLFPAADVTDCAYHMVRANTLGERELYYPRSQMISLQVKLRHLTPWLFDLLTVDNLKRS